MKISQEIIGLVEKSENILLCTHRKPDGDAIGSIMAMYKVLTLLGKKVTATCADRLPESFDFLPEIEQLSREVSGAQDFVVTLDCDKTEVDRLKYHLEDNKIHIIITPKKGRFFKENVTCQENFEKYDLIITVDVADIPQLGDLYTDNKEVFASVPVINIDHHASNTQFGKINLIDLASSSTAEILYGLIKDMEAHFNKELMIPEISTFLLSGITTDTGSFQNANTTPKSMEIAADLMDSGANQQDIIKYLFRTKNLSTLKLWGKILTKIEVDKKHKLIWSTITQGDLRNSGARMDESEGIIDELLVHAPEAEIIALFKEDEGMTSVSLRSKNAQADVAAIAEKFGGGGHVQAAGAKFPKQTLSEVMHKVLTAIQGSQSARLGLADESFIHDKKAPTQVMEGYTPMPESVPVSPTLEEKVREERKEEKSEALSAAADESADVPADVKVKRAEPMPPQPADLPAAVEEVKKTEASSLPAEDSTVVKTEAGAPAPQAPEEKPVSDAERFGMQTPTAEKQGQDLHSQAKAAIMAEQGHVENNPFAGGSTSSPFRQERPKQPRTEKRFHSDELPDFLKPSTEPVEDMRNQPKPNPMPEAKPVEDDSVKVTYNNPPATPEKPTAKPENNFPNPFGDMSGGTGGGQQGDDDQGAGGAAGTTPPKKPEPPKDPFATGDDGLTDIERALGGL